MRWKRQRERVEQSSSRKEVDVYTFARSCKVKRLPLGRSEACGTSASPHRIGRRWGEMVKERAKAQVKEQSRGIDRELDRKKPTERATEDTHPCSLRIAALRHQICEG